MAATGELWSEEPVPVIAAHYSNQIEAAGWTMRGGDVQDRGAWFTWGRRGAREPEQGLFYLLRLPGATSRYLLTIELGVARLSSEDERWGGTFSGTVTFGPDE